MRFVDFYDFDFIKLDYRSVDERDAHVSPGRQFVKSTIAVHHRSGRLPASRQEQ
jgi:hypothetical protein